jgi:hypothetical protein
MLLPSFPRIDDHPFALAFCYFLLVRRRAQEHGHGSDRGLCKKRSFGYASHTLPGELLVPLVPLFPSTPP